MKLASSTDQDELKHYWLTWRAAVGRDAGSLYATYVDLLNTAAKAKDGESSAGGHRQSREAKFIRRTPNVERVCH